MITICVAPLNDFDSVMSRAKRGLMTGLSMLPTLRR